MRSKGKSVLAWAASWVHLGRQKARRGRPHRPLTRCLVWGQASGPGGQIIFAAPGPGHGEFLATAGRWRVGSRRGKGSAFSSGLPRVVGVRQVPTRLPLPPPIPPPLSTFNGRSVIRSARSIPDPTRWPNLFRPNRTSTRTGQGTRRRSCPPARVRGRSCPAAGRRAAHT
jgi:hypothetical protein